MECIVSFSELEWAILQTVAYADIFDYPLTPSEIQRYLTGATATVEEVQAALSSSSLNGRYLSRSADYFSLAGREHIVETRRRRAQVAARLWPVGRRYGHFIGSLPFVRMVAVTGSLAVDNTESGGDIDYLVVTKARRLWLCRLLVVVLVRWVEWRSGYTLCPNYFISENALTINEHDLYTARELVQMVTVFGSETYTTMRQFNAWTDGQFPNATSTHSNNTTPQRKIAAFSKRLIERMIPTSVGDWIDRWEMKRKIRKLSQQSDAREADFSADWCKGHFDGHKRRILDSYDHRLKALKHRQHDLMAKPL